MEFNRVFFLGQIACAYLNKQSLLSICDAAVLLTVRRGKMSGMVLYTIIGLPTKSIAIKRTKGF